MNIKNMLLISCMLVASTLHTAENAAEDKVLVVATHAIINQKACIVTFYGDDDVELGTFAAKRIINRSSMPGLCREVRAEIGVDASQLKKKDITIQNKMTKCAIL